MQTRLTKDQEDRLRRVLAREYTKAKTRRPNLSFRSWSKKLDVSVGALSEFLNGKRSFSKKRVEKLLQKTPLSANDAKRVLGIPNETQMLSWDQYEVLSSWVGIGILSFLQLTGGSSVDEISTRLSLPGKAVHSTLQRLLSLQLVSKHGETWRREAKGLETSDDVKNLSIQNFHRSLLEKAESSLTQVPVSERDFSAMLLPANPEKLKRLKVLIRKFQDQVEDLIQDGEESEVFALSIQCFPITRRKR